MNQNSKTLRSTELDFWIAQVLGLVPKIRNMKVYLVLADNPTMVNDYPDLFPNAPNPQMGVLFQPTRNREQGLWILENGRVSVEIAGDGWMGLVNDVFDEETRQSKGCIGDSFLQAGLRALVFDRYGETVDLAIGMTAFEEDQLLRAAITENPEVWVEQGEVFYNVNLGFIPSDPLTLAQFNREGSLSKKIAAGLLRGEWHPPVPAGFADNEEFVKRFRTVDEDNTCCRIMALGIKPLPERPERCLVYGTIIPSGAMGGKLKELLHAGKPITFFPRGFGYYNPQMPEQSHAEILTFDIVNPEN